MGEICRELVLILAVLAVCPHSSYASVDGPARSHAYFPESNLDSLYVGTALVVDFITPVGGTSRNTSVATRPHSEMVLQIEDAVVNFIGSDVVTARSSAIFHWNDNAGALLSSSSEMPFHFSALPGERVFVVIGKHFLRDEPGFPLEAKDTLFVQFCRTIVEDENTGTVELWEMRSATPTEGHYAALKRAGISAETRIDIKDFIPFYSKKAFSLSEVIYEAERYFIQK